MEPPNTSGGGASHSYCKKTTFAPPYDTVCLAAVYGHFLQLMKHCPSNQASFMEARCAHIIRDTAPATKLPSWRRVVVVVVDGGALRAYNIIHLIIGEDAPHQ